MKEIRLTQNKFALVDDEDFERLNQYKWYFSNGYAKHDSGGRKNRTRLYMHRMALKAEPGQEVDHINRNKLDNRKSNLRFVTHYQNSINVFIRRDNKSGHTGVFLNPKTKKHRAYIDRMNLGEFKSFNEAVLARKEAEQVFHLIRT